MEILLGTIRVVATDRKEFSRFSPSILPLGDPPFLYLSIAEIPFSSSDERESLSLSAYYPAYYPQVVDKSRRRLGRR